MENLEGGIKNHGTKSRNNSLSTYKIHTPKFYSNILEYHVKCKNSPYNLNPNNKTKKTAKDSHHVASDKGSDVQKCHCLIDVLKSVDGEGQEAAYEFFKIVFYSL